ncbi:MAG: 30S ribosomal protein S12 methylthiotransferase RimO [Polyangiaceae bacterium]
MSDKTIHFISLGCPKNRVDSEVMLGVAQKAGYIHEDDPSEADVIVVNTCGFIDPAKKESIDTILAMADYKEEGRCQKLVVAGCLSQRHPDEMAAELPEVDHFLGSSDMLRIGDVLRGDAGRMLVGNPADWVVAAESPRQLSSSPGSAYVKIAEGCNRSCSFCVIPQLRGKQRSRSIDDVVREVEQLVARGVVEVNLISQDTVAYGRDRPGSESLTQLVARVAEVAGLRWLRLFYLYPETLDDGLVDLLADHPRVLPYVDMPLQHAADGMLRRMRRGHGGERLRGVVSRLRDRVAGLTFRTAFIVGHPGETDAEFEELCEFVTWAEFDRVGVFRYSDEETAPSFALQGKVPEEVAAERHEALMVMAQRIAREKNARLVGQDLEVLVEGISDEHDLVLMGRHQGQAPEIDGQVYLSGTEHLDQPLRAGQLVKVRVTQASDYDVAGEVLTVEPRLADARAERRVALRVLPSDNRDLS